MSEKEEKDFSGFEEVRVTETEDGLKWVNIDDLIIALHYAKDLMDKDIDNEIEQCEDDETIKDLLKTKEIFGASSEDLVEALENIIEQFDEDYSEDDDDEELKEVEEDE